VTATNLKNNGLSLLVVFVVSSLFAYFFHAYSPAKRISAATTAPVSARTWRVFVPGSGDPWAIGYGVGIDFPQFAALDPKSGYFRLVCRTNWGTSIVLTPSFGSGNVLTQGMPLAASHHVEGDRLVIDASGSRNGLKATLKVTLSPPGAGGITAEVDGRCEGSITLDTRPGEAFKTVMLSSMRVTADGKDPVSKMWDAWSILVDDRPPIGFNDADRPSDFFLNVTPPTSATRFGFVGGKSDWQKGDPAPSVVIHLDGPTLVAGYRTMDTNPNHDNLAFWASSDTVARSWHYTVAASRP
jgi:hypothetical protein